ncbi:mRNA turnover protein 4 homolog [Centruroides sculpturatus]|uniref:mRNA turnover protein 4 homolog n=1 Tax=Centruroides sculpturatus TaxID=218467 RepID=UPI000C6EF638|nr:mRNA turnover protein 4 homolog [Centruroides sculpturatus]
MFFLYLIYIFFSWFDTFYVTDFARAGSIAEETVTLDKGPLKQFSHSLEPHLRKLGMPTSLQKGVVTLIKDFQVCKEGDVLSPEQAQILKLLGNHTVQFKMLVHSIWTNDGEIEEMKHDLTDIVKQDDDDDDDDDEEEEMSD